MAAVEEASAGGSHEYVTLVSHEGFEFVLDREAACQSRMIKDMLEGCNHYAGSEARNPVVELKDIGAPVLDLVCQYLAERKAAKNTMSEFRQLKALDPNSEQDRKLILELILAADYLDC